MPYLHFESGKNRIKMRHAIENASAVLDGRQTAPEAAATELSKDSLLIQEYLHHNPPLHVRRTLAQFYYHGTDDEVQIQDDDQLVYRYHASKGRKPEILMVDQLWLWVLSSGDGLRSRNIHSLTFPRSHHYKLLRKMAPAQK
jgi:hypothetical protein